MSSMANKRLAGGTANKGSAGNRQKIMLGGLAAVLVVLLVVQVPKLLGGSDSATSAPTVDGTVAVADTTAAPSGIVTPQLSVRDRRTAKMIKKLPARDPFVPLIGPGSSAVATLEAGPSGTPAASPAPVAAGGAVVVPTGAVILANGRRIVVGVQRQFKAGGADFRLVSVTRKGARIAPLTGAAKPGATITLPVGKSVTVKAPAGARSVLRFTVPLASVPTVRSGKSS